jgi:hypothetical protein
MALGRRSARVGVALALVTSLAMGGSAHAAVEPTATKNPYGEVRTAVKFLSIAYTYKTAWFAMGNCGPSIGQRDRAYAAQALDAVLTKVCIAPETDADKTSFTPLSGRVLGARALPGGVTALKVRLTIRYGSVGHKSVDGTLDLSVRMSHGRHGWKAVGVAMPGAFGPTRYCVDSPAAAMHCDIYPPGSY